MGLDSEVRTPPPDEPEDGSAYAGPVGYALAAATVALATAVAWACSRVLSGPDVLILHVMLYVFAVALIATRLSHGPSLVAAVLAAVGIDWLFLPPPTLTASGAQPLLAFGVLIVLAIVITDSATRVRTQTLALRARQRELEVLVALDRALAEAHRPADVARIAAERAVSLLGVDGAAALLLDDHGKTLRLLHAESVPPVVLAIFKQGIPVGAAVAGQAVAERRPVVVDVGHYPDAADVGLAAAVRDSGHASVAATPFVAHGKVYGALSLASRRPLRVTPAMMSLLASVGTRVGLAIALAAERQRLADQERMAALGRLAAGVAHELNNPLTAIANYVGLVEGEAAEIDRSLASRLLRHTKALDEAVERMRRIVSGLGTYSKPPRTEPQRLNIGELLEATRELVGFSAKTSGVKIVVEASPALPVVLGDRSAMMQVLLNLANNGIEAMTGGGQLTLKAWAEPNRLDPTSAVVKIMVSDTGAGIAPEHLPRIWDAFYTSKAEGTGLGLSIVRGIVTDTPGASIDVESEPGRGTAFTLMLPAAPTRPA